VSENVIPFRPELVGDGASVAVDDVLSRAVGKLTCVTVIGVTTEGALYVAGSDGAADSVFLMERAKAMLVDCEVMRR
jgi:hypothetical protein